MSTPDATESTPAAGDALTAHAETPATAEVAAAAAEASADASAEALGEGSRSGTPASRANRGRTGSASSPAQRALASLAIVAALHLARGILVPVALAAFVAFLLSPIARAIEKLRIPRGGAATMSVLALSLAMSAVIWESGSQTLDLARRLPEFRERLNEKFSMLKSGSASSPIMEASKQLKELEGTLTPDREGAPATGSDPKTAPSRDGRNAAAVPVRVVTDPPTPLEIYSDLVGSVLGPLGDAAVVIFLAIFLLTYRTDVRERVIALGSAHRIGVSSQALEEAGKRVSRYLLANLAVNALYGTAVGIALYVIGLPSAPLWGLLCALLRFVPYVGTWMGAALPIALSIAVFDGWGKTGAVFASILGIDLVVGNIVEPLVYGHRTGLSPLAVVLSTVFWTWVWGIPGLLLAIPMTLCLAVVGRYVPGFGVFHVLLGNEPILDPAERAYERLIVFDAAGASKAAAEVRERIGAAAADDAVLLSALRRAERDRREGQLDEERYLAICDGVREAIDASDPPPATVAAAGTVLCLPAFAESDRVACELLAHHLALVGVAAEIGPNATTISDAVPRAVREGVSAVCIVALPPFAGLRVRYGIRRARSQAPDARYIGIVLDPDADKQRIGLSLRQAGAADTKFSLADAVAALAPQTESTKPPSRLDGLEARTGESAPLAEAEKTA